jgi:mycothiol synthase
MVWPVETASQLFSEVPCGYNLRQYRVSDEKEYQRLISAAGMEFCPLWYWERHILPEGFFVVECVRSRQIVAACFASHHPSIRHFRGGNLGWLAVDPSHRGKGLGCLVATEVTRRLTEAGYKNIYLETHDHRLSAIKIYLTMGWKPLLYCEGMWERWNEIHKKLKLPF